MRRFVITSDNVQRADNDSTTVQIEDIPEAASTSYSVPGSTTERFEGNITVIDSVHRQGARLVEMDDEVADAMNSDPNMLLRVVPQVDYPLPETQFFLQRSSFDQEVAEAGPDAREISFFCTDANTKKALPGVEVLLGNEDGPICNGKTDSNGKVSILILRPDVTDRLWALTDSNHWGASRRNLDLREVESIEISIPPVILPYSDAVAKYYGNSKFDSETGVVVGILDSGVGPHPDLNVIGGQNTVTGELASAFEDWKGHGTHVAGLVGASPSQHAGIRGLAPGVMIRSYRVFGDGARGASNYAIMKAMILAVDDGCDIINLSVGGGPEELIVAEAIQDARNRGVLVVVSAGNNGRKEVTFPAAYPGAIAVSAMGLEESFPAGALCESEILRPPEVQNSPEFIASFSNMGPKVTCSGLGVGVLSTLPHGGYGPSSGTSMAAPVVAGVAACLLSQSKDIYNMPRTRARSDALEAMLLSSCIPRGFGPDYEGAGLPNVEDIQSWQGMS
ncbi:S8 family peptidase [Paracoccus sp. T5]|uniref:S8 family peptidase n=1 Tax=Paracoccus sp. T5 TaxID=3402161 RepID=UPI003AEBABC0